MLLVVAEIVLSAPLLLVVAEIVLSVPLLLVCAGEVVAASNDVTSVKSSGSGLHRLFATSSSMPTTAEIFTFLLQKSAGNLSAVAGESELDGQSVW